MNLIKLIESIYIMNAQKLTHAQMVTLLVKDPVTIANDLGSNPTSCDLIHATMGISGEAGELLDAIKKNVIYNKPLDIENIVEELGDLEFYMEQLRQQLNITREETLEANYNKLMNKRYPNGYSDEAAITRADKVGE